MPTRLGVSEAVLADFCLNNHIRKLALFGSVLREDFSAESDIDMLVEFEPGQTPGFAFFRVQDELSQLFGRKVDLNTPGFLSDYFRDRVVTEAVVLYNPPEKIIASESL